MKGDVNISKLIKRILTLIVTLAVCITVVLAVYVYTANKGKEIEIPFLSGGNHENTGNNGTQKLDQIVFLGDSITQGYVTYEKVPISQVIFLKGLSVEGMLTTQMYHIDKVGKSIDFLREIQPKYLYVGFGMNDLERTPEEFITLYEQHLQEIMLACPNTIIGLVSITPIIDTYKYDNETVNEFNRKIYELVEKIGRDKCHYINIHNILLDETGSKINSEYGAGDGIHLNSNAYDVILDYIKNNPID